MKLLLIDNDSDTLIQLRALCDTIGYDVTTIHCSQLDNLDTASFDLIVLSGGYWYDNELQHLDVYASELALIRNTQIPLIGICLGMQLMHVAFSGHVPLLDAPQSGLKSIIITNEGQHRLTLPKRIMVHKNHTRGVMTATESFVVLGHSNEHLEIMLHASRPLIGVQFHPEIGELEHNSQLMNLLIRAIMT